GAGVLPASGEVARLRMSGFIGDSLGTEIMLAANMEPSDCLELSSIGGRIEVDSICGLSLRLMEVGSSGYALLPNVPNPFNPMTEFRFVLGLSGWTIVEISDSRGEVVERLIEQELPAGEHHLWWDASRESSGVYYCRVVSGDWQSQQAIVVVK
ncbi:MAG: hypothetical protein IT211_02155, partial [Armatimonadetes bacterium]|nr:hypothetical protein [Armatimonadota bacterium]